MGYIHHLKPVVAHGFERCDPLANAIDQYFAAAAGNRTETGPRKSRDDFFERQPEYFAKMNELAGAESVDIDAGKFIFDMRKQIQVPIQGQLWVMSALHQNLGPPQRDRFFNLPVDFGVRDHISIGISLHAVESTELAID